MSFELRYRPLPALSMVMTEHNVELGSLSCEYSEHELFQLPVAFILCSFKQ